MNIREWYTKIEEFFGTDDLIKLFTNIVNELMQQYVIIF